MKLFCIFIAATLPMLSDAATNELITFTNRQGRVFDQVRISGSDASGVFYWSTNGAGGKLPFTNAPEFLQQQFHYDPSVATKFDTASASAAAQYKQWQEADAARLGREQATALAYKKRREKFLSECRWFEGEVLQRTDGLLHVNLVLKRSGYRISGSFAPGGNGTVASWDASTARIAVTNHPQQESLKIHTKIGFWAHPDGDYDYTTILGEKKTLSRFDSGIPAEFANDKIVLSAFTTPGVWTN